MAIKVVLVEDDPVWISRIYWLLNKTTDDIALLGCVSSNTDALTLTKYVEVDVVLVDVSLCDEKNGVDLIPEFMKTWSNAKIIMLSSVNDSDTIRKSFINGATNYILKSSYTDIPKCIREAYTNQATIHCSSAEILRQGFRKLRQVRTKSLPILTPQERRILVLVKQGKTTEQIMDDLCIELQTLQNHIHNLNKKLRTANRKQAAETACSLGLLDGML